MVEQDLTSQPSKGERRGLYEGVLLWPVLERAGLLERVEHAAEIRRTFLVTAGEGCGIAFSVGELPADFGDTPAMIAWAADGAAPLPPDEGLRLIAPGDTRGARNVVAIEPR